MDLVDESVCTFSNHELVISVLEQQLDACFSPVNNENEVDPCSRIGTLNLNRNQLTSLPRQISRFCNLRVLDLSSNNLSWIDDSLSELRFLRCLVIKNNFLTEDSLPKDFGALKCLQELNLSGNQFASIPQQILELSDLRALYMGGNRISNVPVQISQLQCLEILYLGGNVLTELPATMGRLQNLQALILCENNLESLPATISHLRRLRSLSLHKNSLKTLPPEIVTLRGLEELTLRDNPLVVRFVKDMTYDPPSLLELAARCVKVRNVPTIPEELPPNLCKYLETAQRCVNPKCKGVYFDTHVEHIKFVDFCGKYKIPLLQYLCSPRCTVSPAVYSSESSDLSEDDVDVPASRMKKVLLG